MSRRCMGCMETFEDGFDVCPHCGYVVGTPPEEAIHIEPGSILHDRYVIGRVLGYGGFGVTYLAWDGKLEQKVAVKEYLPSEFSTRMPGHSMVSVFNGDKSEQFHDGMNKFIDEARRLAKFQNEPGIVCVYDSFAENGTAYIIMEYLEGETLSERLKREKTIPEEEAVNMMWPIMQSLKVVHAQGILHRDIAPDNIFITTDGEVKLIDFGASRYATTSHSRSLSVIIKPGYSPEEQYRSRGDQGPHTDVYAVAATLYKMITGKTPPDAMERRAKIESKKKELLEDPSKLIKGISVNRENAILNAMNVQIEDRTPDMETLMSELNADPPAKRRYGKIKKIDVYSWPLWIKILIPALAACFVVFGVLLATGVIDFPSLFSDVVVVPDGMAIVPDVEGLDKEEAYAELDKAGLNYTGIGTVISQYVDEGKIIFQDPVGGTYLMQNEMVQLKICGGNGEVVAAADGIAKVPYLEWVSQEEALDKIQRAGLAEPEIQYESSESVEAGLVIRQSIESGTEVKEGSKITLVISTGPASFELPNVVGMSEADAADLLRKKGLTVVTDYAKDNSASEGTVLSQKAAAGTAVKRGDKVTITVCSGKNTISVPNVTGMDSQTAQQTLKNAGFAVSVAESFSATVDKGYVISQNPAAGGAQVAGTTITIVVSKGSDLFAVPSVVGQTEEQAKSTLSGAGFEYSVSTAYSNTVPKGTVISQENAGAMMKKGTVIPFTVSLGLQTVTVSFNANGGTLSGSSSISVAIGGTYSGMPSASRTGYTFDGWYTAQSGGSQVSGSSTCSNTSNHTLYAHWTENSWSGWTDSLPSGVSDSGYYIESKTEYRSKTKSTTTGTSSTMDGWTLTKSEITSWGAWSAWQNDAIASSASRQVETQTIDATYNTEYNYSRYMDANNYYCGPSVGYWSGSYCYIYRERGWGGSLGSPDYSQGFPIYYEGPYAWFNETTRQVEVTPAYTQYRYRDGIYTYYFEKWSDWSGWSGTAVTADSNTQVESRTIYRYKKK